MWVVLSDRRLSCESLERIFHILCKRGGRRGRGEISSLFPSSFSPRREVPLMHHRTCEFLFEQRSTRNQEVPPETSGNFPGGILVPARALLFLNQKIIYWVAPEKAPFFNSVVGEVLPRRYGIKATGTVCQFKISW